MNRTVIAVLHSPKAESSFLICMRKRHVEDRIDLEHFDSLKVAAVKPQTCRMPVWENDASTACR